MTDHLSEAREAVDGGALQRAQANALIDIAESLRKLIDAQKPKTISAGGYPGGGGGGGSSIAVSVGVAGGGGGGGGGGGVAPVPRELPSLNSAVHMARAYRWIDRDGEEWRYSDGLWRYRFKDGSWTTSVVPDERYGSYRRLA